MADCVSTESEEAHDRMGARTKANGPSERKHNIVKVQEAMNAAGNVAISGLRKHNNLQQMISSGSKAPYHIQTAACVGQQNLLRCHQAKDVTAVPYRAFLSLT